MRARRPNRPGEVILTEPLLLNIPIPVNAWAELYTNEADGTTDYIEKAVNRLKGAARTAFNALIDHDEEDIERAKYNSFSDDNGFHIFNEISRLYHSCTPNAWVNIY